MTRPSPPVQQALQLLHSIKPITRPMEAFMSAHLQVRSFQPNEFILRNGETCDHLNFVAEGLVQIFSDAPAKPELLSKEICNWFLMEGDLVMSVESFFGRTPTDEYIQAIEPTTLVSIRYDDLQDVYAAFPEFNYHGRILTQTYYIKAIRQLKALRYKRAADSYRYLQVHCPNLLQRVPARHLAGYLGVDETYVRALHAKRETERIKLQQ
ncbi:MAG: Crp/Fnr family transcriptional regulator [Chitinophagaceae bacterium]|nr:Crp/Fnr family transcriptional regulator [Chitinophagaceae bacterium]